MNRTKRRSLLLVACVASLALVAAAHPARAAFVYTLAEVGNDVILTGSGSLNVSALTPSDGAAIASGFNPNFAVATVGTLFDDGGGLVDVYEGVVGPGNFGNDGDVNFEIADSGTGSAVGIFGAGGELRVPEGYISNNDLFGTATFNNASFASLGFRPGTYTYIWGSGADADSLTITGAVPEPSTWVLTIAGAGLLAFGVTRRRYRRAT